MNSLGHELDSHLRAIDESLNFPDNQSRVIMAAKLAGSLVVEAIELTRYGTRAFAERLHIVRK